MRDTQRIQITQWEGDFQIATQIAYVEQLVRNLPSLRDAMYSQEDVIAILNSVEDELEVEDAPREVCFKFLETAFKPVLGQISSTSG